MKAEDLCHRIELEKLYPKFREKLLQTLQICLDDGKIYIPTVGVRTQAEQDKAYKDGKSQKRFGYHLIGLAADCAFHKAPTYNKKLNPSWSKADMEAYGIAAKAVGLTYGGDWKTLVDTPHIELSKGLNLKELNKIYNQGGVKAVWEYLDRFFEQG